MKIRNFIIYSAVVFAFAFWSAAALSQTAPDGAAGAAAAEESAESKDAAGAEAPKPAVNSEFGRWDKIFKDCADAGGPIIIDEFMPAAANLMRLTNDASLIGSLRELMTCMQLDYMDDNYCDAGEMMVEPYFTKPAEATQTKLMDKKDKQKIAEMISQAEEGCVADALLVGIYRGDTIFRGKDIADGICAMYGEKLKLGPDCEKGVVNYMEAIEQGDPSACGSFPIEEARDLCRLFATMDPGVCKTGAFKSTSYESCLGSLAAFKILRRKAVGKDEVASAAIGGALLSAVKSMRNENYCKSLYVDRLLPLFCRGKHLVEFLKEEAGEAKILENIKKLEEEKKQKEAAAESDKPMDVEKED